MGVGYSYALAHVEKEFVAVQQLAQDEPARRNISYQELLSAGVPEDLRVNLNHIAILYCLDANRDGLFSYDDLVAFVMWAASALPNEISRNASEFSDAVQARCVLRLWSECKAAGSNDTFVEWLCGFLSRAHPNNGPATSSGGKLGTGRDSSFELPNAIRDSDADVELPRCDQTQRQRHSIDGFGGGEGDEEGEGDRESGEGIPTMVSMEASTPTTPKDAQGPKDRDAGRDDAFRREKEWFTLSALHTLYTLLNVRDGYGLDFHVFCQVLSGEPYTGDPPTSQAAGLRDSSGTISTETPSRYHLPKGMEKGGFGDDDVLVPGASVRAFLGSFIESYWGILQKLGLEVLLSDTVGETDGTAKASPKSLAPAQV